MLKKRLEILISNDEFLLLKEKARESKCSIGELVRESIREKYFVDKESSRKDALKKIASSDLALPEAVEWEDIEKHSSLPI
ncbi:MAG: hypothetical protein PWQ82_1269 [Thermosediminibacterales bacterium]|nr:hypothetical protein [Thermosediminibacterales bacterium]